MRHKYLDLLLCGGLAVIAVGVAAYGAYQSPWFAWTGIALTLALPGYALSMAVLPRLDYAERLLYSFGLTLVFDVLGGFVLDATPWGLRPQSWVVWLSGITLVCCCVAWLNRRSTQARIEPSAVLSLSRESVFGFGVALIIAIIAVATAQQSVRGKDLAFTQLWAVPENSAGTCSLQIGINNQENKSQSYELFIESGGKGIERWPRIELGSNKQWMTELKFSECPSKTISVLLYLQDHLGEAYRANLVLPASFNSPPSNQ